MVPPMARLLFSNHAYPDMRGSRLFDSRGPTLGEKSTPRDPNRSLLHQQQELCRSNSLEKLPEYAKGGRARSNRVPHHGSTTPPPGRCPAQEQPRRKRPSAFTLCYKVGGPSALPPCFEPVDPRERDENV